MSSEKTENPVLLWGDMGPDVYKLSQIYDPRNDKYVTTQDTSVKKDDEGNYITYYERLDMILTSDTTATDGKAYYKRIVDEVESYVEYVQVSTSELKDANPAENKWYQDSGGKVKVFSKVNLEKWAEDHSTTVDKINPYLPYGTQGLPEEEWIHWYVENPDPENTCGKFVPAVNSLVVVDETECYYKTENKYKTRMLLIVKSVDYALNVTFATVVFGTDIEETTRAIDYGNEKFMLFFNRKTGASFDNVQLTPDRKLMLYGSKSYAYRLKRDGVIISKNRQTIQTSDDALIPYVRAAGKVFVVTADNFQYLAESMPYLDVILPTGFSRFFMLQDDEGSVLPSKSLIRTFDIRFKTGVQYYAKVGDAVTAINAPTDFAIGAKIIDWEKNDTAGRLVYREVGQDANNNWNGDLIGRVVIAFEKKPSETPSSCVHLPDYCYLRSNFSIVDSEPILMEIFEFDSETNDANMIMSLTLTSKEAAALDLTDVTTRQIVKFDVELNGHDDIGDIWYLQQGEDWREVFNVVPKISFDDGSDLTVPVDGKTCYRYGFEDINSTLVGREFQVLFKFFPHKTLNVDWQKVGLTPTKNYLYCCKTIKIINNLAYKIRKISLIPAWDQAAQAYDFHFMIFRNDFESPPIIRSSIDTKYMIETYKVTEDVAVVTTKVYYKKENTGYFLAASLDASKPISEQGFTVYERTLQPKTTIDDVQYINANGDEMYVGATAAGSNFDVTQRGKLSEKVTIRGMNAEALYTQDVRFRLQNMMLKSKSTSVDDRLPYKWLIGDDHTSYEGETMPYGKVPKRPYLLFRNESVKPDDDETLYVYDATLTTTVKYREATDAEKASSITRLYVKRNDHYYIVSDSTIGAYRVDGTEFSDSEVFLDAFYKAAQPPRGVAEDGTVENEEFTPTHFFIRSVCDDSACTEFVEITEGGTTHLNPVLMEGGGTSEKNIGGAIPCKVDDVIYGQGTTNLMGTVIVQFVHRYTDPDDATKFLYKHLYAVPVETRDETWTA